MKDRNALLFNNNWKFLLGDPKNAGAVKYPDASWKRVDLPHDWVISQPFKRGEPRGYTHQNMQGFFAWEGIAWYRKEFELANIEGKDVFIYFGGAYRNSAVFVNGKPAGGRAYGYSSFELDITDLVKEGKNLIAVRLNNACEKPDRWYSGAGLYRNVFLKVLPRTHIKTWGVRVKTELPSGKSNTATVTIEMTIVDKRKQGRGELLIKLGSVPAGSSVPISESSVPFKIENQSEITVTCKFKVNDPKLWASETPEMYCASIQLLPTNKSDKLSNETNSHIVEVPFGFRDIKITYKKGMKVNGKTVKLKGVCLHHDCGITGSAFYKDAWRRRLSVLKSIGCNAIRTSHNTPAEEFLDLCDEMGFYVIDECFDKWKSGYYASHFDADAKRDLEDMVLRDINHPSIFMWSVGNEVENQGASSMIEIQKQLAGFIRALDDRPVTCALSPHANPRSLVGAPAETLVELTKKLADGVDVLGFNYHEDLYNDYTAGIEKPIVGTECYEYYTGTALNFEDIIYKNPWRYVQENDNVIGQFIWAGIDYLGEAAYPSKGWTGSILDICGFYKPNAWYRKSIWSDEPTVYIAFYNQAEKPNYARGRWSFPSLASHLNLDHFDRRTVTAAVYSNCDEVELWINGKKMGKRNPADFENNIIEWTIEYVTGEIKTIGFRGGKEVCSYTIKTVGAPEKIKLIPDKIQLQANSGDIAHIEINITDKNGILCQTEDLLIDFALAGDGEILGACSPDFNSDLGFTLPKTYTSGGKALLMIKAGASAGTLELTAYSEKLKTAAVRIKVYG